MRRTTTLGAVFAAAILLAGCGDPTPSATPPASTPPADDATPPAAPSVYLDPAPRETTPDAYVSFGEPPTQFARWDGVSTTIYDLETLAETNLGPGNRGTFSPDSSKFVWMSGTDWMASEARLLDLETGIVTNFGPARVAAFLDDEHLRITQLPADGEIVDTIVDLTTGARTIATTPVAAPTPAGLPRLRVERPRDHVIVVVDAATDDVLFTTNAYTAVPVDDDTLLASTLTYSSARADADTRGPGTHNIYLIHVSTREAEFVATSAFIADERLYDGADANYVAWVDDFCSDTPGRTRIYDRRTKKITQLDVSGSPSFPPAGMVLGILYGEWRIVDVESMRYRAVIRAPYHSYSSDGRYISVGKEGGHGGLCI